jgi:hypothetical protein
MYAAASNFCHGFAVGVFRVLQEEDAARRSNHLFRLPNPAPIRNERIASFVHPARSTASNVCDASPHRQGQRKDFQLAPVKTVKQLGRGVAATVTWMPIDMMTLGALVRVSVRRIQVAMASACPCQNEFGFAYARLRNAVVT